jgi:hypothetical protein
MAGRPICLIVIQPHPALHRRVDQAYAPIKPTSLRGGHDARGRICLCEMVSEQDVLELLHASVTRVEMRYVMTVILKIRQVPRRHVL